MHDLELGVNIKPRSNISMPFEIPYITSCLLAVVTCTMSVIICEIITYELSKYPRFELLNITDSNH